MSQTTKQPRILIVDDEPSARVGLEKLLRVEGFATATADRGETALVEAERFRPDVISTDLKMPGIDGFEVCARMHEIDANAVVIVVTAAGDTQSVIEGSTRCSIERRRVHRRRERKRPPRS